MGKNNLYIEHFRAYPGLPHTSKMERFPTIIQSASFFERALTEKESIPALSNSCFIVLIAESSIPDAKMPIFTKQIQYSVQ